MWAALLITTALAIAETFIITMYANDAREAERAIINRRAKIVSLRHLKCTYKHENNLSRSCFFFNKKILNQRN